MCRAAPRSWRPASLTWVKCAGRWPRPGPAESAQDQRVGFSSSWAVQSLWPLSAHRQDMSKPVSSSPRGMWRPRPGGSRTLPGGSRLRPYSSKGDLVRVPHASSGTRCSGPQQASNVQGTGVTECPPDHLGRCGPEEAWEGLHELPGTGEGWLSSSGRSSQGGRPHLFLHAGLSRVGKLAFLPSAVARCASAVCFLMDRLLKSVFLLSNMDEGLRRQAKDQMPMKDD